MNGVSDPKNNICDISRWESSVSESYSAIYDVYMYCMYVFMYVRLCMSVTESVYEDKSECWCKRVAASKDWMCWHV